MAPLLAKKAARGDSGVQLMPLIFACDELPTTFSKRVRRPIAPLVLFEDVFFAFPPTPNDGYTPDSDGEDGDGLDHEDVTDGIVDRRSPASAAGPVTQYSESVYTSAAPAPTKIRVVGGRAAVPKKIGLDLDSEDELIKTMKEQGETNERIVQRLVERQGTRYDPKTIATRYSRIKRLQNEAEERRMEDEFSDYHEDEDARLQEAFDTTGEWFTTTVAMLEDQRWKKVQEVMKGLIDKSKYSSRACRERFESLKEGTATVPQEQDPDPERRAAEAAERVEKRIGERAAAQEKRRREAAEKLRIKQEKLAEEAKEFQKRWSERIAIQEEKSATVAERKAAAEARELARERAILEKEAAIQARREAKEESERQRQDEKAARAFEREQAKELREARLLEEKLAKVDRQREAKLAKLEELRDTNLSLGIIRRTLRHAGLDLRAPLDNATRIVTPNSTSKVVTGMKRVAPGSYAGDDDEDNKSPASKPRKKVKGKANAPKIPQSGRNLKYTGRKG